METNYLDDNETEPVLGRDIPWNTIDGELCRVVRFTPFGKVENNKVVAVSGAAPYAFLTVECKKLKQNCSLWVTHKMDFKHLWEAFEKRGIKEKEEVLIFWSNRHYKYRFFKIFSAFLPKMWVMICPKNTYEIKTNSDFQPELTGEARFKATLPIVEWKPEIMD